jgi:hypothetical protein
LPASNTFGWNNTDVTVRWSCTDALSGTQPTPLTLTTVVSTEGANQTATNTCRDRAGNATEASAPGISIDRELPTLTASVAPNPALRNLSAVATPVASDALSQINTVSCPTPLTTAVGSFSVTCTATDRAGNQRQVSAGYTVISATTGITNLITQVRALRLRTLENPLVVKLRAAESALTAGNATLAIANMNDFITLVQSQAAKGIRPADAAALIRAAQALIQSIQRGI